MKKKRILWITVAALVLVLVIGCAVYVGDYYRADSAALEALQGSEAVLDVNAAAGIPEAFPEVSRWYIGGHSLGGSSV